MKKQPNIVFIISDDQGYWSLGCSGNEEIISPNIDRLAQEGMRFENFFCTSPVCSPARASLLTGTIPSQHGVHDWLRDDDEKQSALEYLAGQDSYTKALADIAALCPENGIWEQQERYSRDLPIGSVINPAAVLITALLCTRMEFCTGRSGM